MSVKLKNIAPNFHEVSIKGVTLYFSYETIVGFANANGVVVSENLWGPTTGKHLNRIGDKSDRVSREIFDAKLEQVLSGYTQKKRKIHA